MGTLIQHRPAYFSGFKNEVVMFKSLNELLDSELVDNFRKLPNGQINPKFYRYSISEYSDHKKRRYILMAEFDNGYEWWVIGYVDENDIIKKLPIWKSKYKSPE